MTPLERYYAAKRDYETKDPMSGPWFYRLLMARHNAQTCSEFRQALAQKGIRHER